MDMNGDGLVDLAVGSIGAAVLLWSVNPWNNCIIESLAIVAKKCMTLQKRSHHKTPQQLGKQKTEMFLMTTEGDNSGNEDY